MLVYHYVRFSGMRQLVLVVVHGNFHLLGDTMTRETRVGCSIFKRPSSWVGKGARRVGGRSTADGWLNGNEVV